MPDVETAIDRVFAKFADAIVNKTSFAPVVVDHGL